MTGVVIEPEQATPFRRYSIYGISLASDYPFTYGLSPTRDDPDVIFTCRQGPVPDFDRENETPIFESLPRGPRSERLLTLYRHGDTEVLHFLQGPDFVISGNRIVAYISHPQEQLSLEGIFLGPVLCYWLECRGVVVLHASVVRVGGGAILFLGESTSGKSSLAAEFVASGHALASDDIAPVRVVDGNAVVYPGHHEMRMWPELAERFVRNKSALSRVHPQSEKQKASVLEADFGAFQSEPLVIEAMYVLDRVDAGEAAEVAITPIPQRDAVIDLVRNSFGRFLVQALGFQPARLAQFAAIAENVPVRRLRYPNGLDRLKEVRQAIVEDLTR